MEDTKIPVFGKDTEAKAAEAKAAEAKAAEAKAAEAKAAAAKAKADTEAAAAEAAEAAKAVKLVKMVRGSEFPAPHEADVHPEEVANYAVGGWTAAV